MVSTKVGAIGYAGALRRLSFAAIFFLFRAFLARVAVLGNQVAGE